ncbi:MAG: DUF460 domain-containing protein [Methanocalculus sp. MSAO_Arc1]|uniref:DUF460 domain-containing protein n=1 Tax=Methanocalculus TaxID=71151 RepID=UPI000FF41F02|nr:MULTISPECIES: DUF460 domain-containing protein [unclassified Methanocalculus]MCP1663296.1 putative RNase H-like nuclease (RuvC/YqgF family) [Methanocalculus sp. AMF5]RQD79555.1 MAG: DUF460 domain-containing protein [Methanocalculus sp. MSAO_Arc1]
MKVYGIDIVRGSVRSRSRRPHFALCRVIDDEIVSETEVSLFRLLRIIEAEEPDILAVDSLQEVAADTKELFAFLQSLPPKTDLVCVTGGGDHRESLAQVAGRYNLSFNRFDPYAEARTSALVAGLGAGCRVVAFADSCLITVSRRRSPGKGGWSQNRFTRKIHGAVRTQAREIEMRLVDAGLKYDKKEFRAFGGNSRVIFHVNTPGSEIPIKNQRGTDVQVVVARERLERIKFVPQTTKPRYLIVGIDPGTTMALSLLDLDGDLIHLSSSRVTSVAEAIAEITAHGRPLIIASDKKEMPGTVEKIRRAFHAVPFLPKHDLAVSEKTECAGGIRYENDHERDAYAAAMMAYRHYKNKFASLSKRIPAGVALDEVRARVVRGSSLEQALVDLTPAEPEEASSEDETDAPAVTGKAERPREHEEMIRRLRSLVSELYREVQEKDEEIVRLRRSVKAERSKGKEKIRRDAEISRLEGIISNQKRYLRREERRNKSLRKQLERLKTYADLKQGEDLVPLKVLEALSRDAIRRLRSEMGALPDDWIYLLRTDGWGMNAVRELAETMIAGVIVPDRTHLNSDLVVAFREAGIPLLDGDGLGIRLQGSIGACPGNRLLQRHRQWQDEQEQYIRDKKAESIEGLFRDYRSMREREVRKGG